MNWVYTTTLVVHMLCVVGLIGLVLLQRGKGADAGAGFGAGASGTVFGARGSASFLSRSTAVLATLFFATSLTLVYLSGNPVKQTSVVESLPTPAPATTAPPPAANTQPVEAPAAPVEQPTP